MTGAHHSLRNGEQANEGIIKDPIKLQNPSSGDQEEQDPCDD